MAFSLKPRLSGENSIITSLATVALVVGIYQSSVGPISDVHATNAHDPNLRAATQKAGWMSVVAVAGVALLAHDPNIVILGGAAVLAEEFSYRHALMTNPATGKMQITPQAYQPAGGVPVDPAAYAAAAG
jgi:hypothetical protein